jgi:hypothetical protein
MILRGLITRPELPSESRLTKAKLTETVQLLMQLKFPERVNLEDVLVDENVNVRGDKVGPHGR